MRFCPLIKPRPWRLICPLHSSLMTSHHSTAFFLLGVVLCDHTKPPQFLLHSVWHQGVSPSVPVCVQHSQQSLVKIFPKGLVNIIVLYHIGQQVICKHLEEQLPAHFCQSYISKHFWARLIFLFNLLNSQF